MILINHAEHLIMVRCFMLSSFFLYCNPISGQERVEMNDKGSAVVSTGVGLSWGFAVIAIRTNDPSTGYYFPSLYNDDLYKVSSTPVIGCAYEKRIHKSYSVGGAISYQSYHVANSATVDNGDVYTRTNIGIRGLAHLGRNPKLDMYFVGRIGYTFWRLTTKNQIPGYAERQDITDLPSIQILYGMRYFPGQFGVGYEVGLGTAPYLAMLNICYRFRY